MARAGKKRTVRSTKSLRAQLRSLQVLLDAIPAPIFYKDANGIYLGCNVAFERYLGLSREQIVGKSVYDISPRDLADVYYRADKALFDQPGVQTYETNVAYADGVRRDVTFYKATFLGPDGALGGLVGTILDITERKRAEALLRASEERYRGLIEGSIQGIVVQRDWMALFANSAFATMLGYASPAELIGLDVRRFIVPDHLPLVEGFAATLEETLSADLVLHVADASEPDERLDGTIAAVEAVLSEIGADELPIELVLNKLDLVDPLRRRRLGNRFPDALQISARSGEGLAQLRAHVAARFADRFRPVRLLVPYDHGRILTELYELGAPIEERSDRADGVLVHARLPERELARFAPYLVADVPAASARKA